VRAVLVTCRCAPNNRCMSCPEALLELAVQFCLECDCCGSVDGDSVCTVKAKGKPHEHKYERADSIIPIS
jgi:hypothetical protein